MPDHLPKDFTMGLARCRRCQARHLNVFNHPHRLVHPHAHELLSSSGVAFSLDSVIRISNAQVAVWYIPNDVIVKPFEL